MHLYGVPTDQRGVDAIMSPPQERTVLVSGSSFLSIDRGITVDSRKNETPGSQIDL